MTPSPPKTWFHLDMDGLDAIYEAHGRVYGGGRDAFYESAVRRSLEFFAAEGVRATYFVIARDLDDPLKRAAIEAVVRAGHPIACHGFHHRNLRLLDRAGKTVEVVDSKRKIEDALGVACEGFRAPGYSIDFESLELLRDAGYRYDSSIFPVYAFRKRLGLQRLFPEPFLLFPEERLFEVPQPSVAPFLPPFHPCYAFYLSELYFRASLRRFRRRHRYLTLLFHLTDFADRQHLRDGLRL
ncbi:MAG: polysaccharide deacetylase family protein, partial [Candidatus Binatia bacterium]